MGREEVRPMVGEKLIKKNVEGKIIAMVQRFEDNVVSVYVPEQGLKVLSDGSRIEIVAPRLLKSRTVGLCGDMNGEITADLKTPGMCVMRPRLAAITYMLNKSGSESGFERCSGLSGFPLASSRSSSVNPPGAPVKPSSQPQSLSCTSASLS